MGYNFRVGRVVLNDPLKLVLIDLKLSDIVGRVVENYWTHFMEVPLHRHLGRWFLRAHGCVLHKCSPI
jgi:hypothetical protein